MKNFIDYARNEKITFKAKAENELFLKSLLPKGNKKLQDYRDNETGIFYRYFQFNLPARTTCPYASEGCVKFCYAKRDERHTSVKKSRINALEDAKKDNFTNRMIYTIETHLSRPIFRKNGDIMILRIHESGDFFNLKYLRAWVKVFKHFKDNKQVIFQFYTKSFKFFIDLSIGEKRVINYKLKNNTIGFSLSKDDSMIPEQIERIRKCRKIFKLANIYYCTANKKALARVKKDNFCNCENCAKCQHCVKTTGRTIGVEIH